MPYLQRVQLHNSPYWYALLEQDRANLEHWLPHLKDIQSLADAHAYITRYAQLDIYFGEHIYEIWEGEVLVGLISLHSGRMQEKTAELGYWLGAAYRGQGLGAAACQLLLSKTFLERDLQQIFIRCDQGNYASQAVAKCLGFQFLGAQEAVLKFGMTKVQWMEDFYDADDLFCFLD